MLAALSCQLSQHENAAVVQTEGEGQKATTTAATGLRQVPLVLNATQAEGPSRVVATLMAPPCDAKDEMRIKARLSSRFGNHDVQFRLIQANVPPQSSINTEGDAASEPRASIVSVEVDGYAMRITEPSPLAFQLGAAQCQSEAPVLIVDRTTTDQIRQWLERLAPDCERIELMDAAWQCKLPTVDPEAARLELLGMRTTMIRRWSRQPYLLARRLAIGVTLSEALLSNEPQRELDTFCRVLRSSLPAELPATLASTKWQQVACDAGNDGRIDAALFGLAKTITEIDVMRQLFERTSRLGHLAVRIPESVVPGKQILVSLTPESDVAESLTRETARIWASDIGGEGDQAQVPRACWHPVYAENPSLLQLARQLSMVGDAESLSCLDAATAQGANQRFEAERYFAASITSETEFVVTNGRAKTLRLPQGHYSYTLRVLPDNPSSWDDTAQDLPQSQGRITWENKRPRPVISTW